MSSEFYGDEEEYEVSHVTTESAEEPVTPEEIINYLENDILKIEANLKKLHAKVDRIENEIARINTDIESGKIADEPAYHIEGELRSLNFKILVYKKKIVNSQLKILKRSKQIEIFKQKGKIPESKLQKYAKYNQGNKLTSISQKNQARLVKAIG